MSRTLLAGFVAGGCLGAYTNTFGLEATLVVLAFALVGTLVAAGGRVALLVDRKRLLELFGELE